MEHTIKQLKEHFKAYNLEVKDEVIFMQGENAGIKLNKEFIKDMEAYHHFSGYSHYADEVNFWLRTRDYRDRIKELEKEIKR